MTAMKIQTLTYALLIACSGGCGLLPAYPGIVDSEPVSGIVTDDDGSPISDALILVITPAGSIWTEPKYRVRRHAITDVSGSFNIPPDPAFVTSTGTYGYGAGKPHFLVIHPRYSATGIHTLYRAPRNRNTDAEERFVNMRIKLGVHPFSLQDDNACGELDARYCDCVREFLRIGSWSCE